MNSAQIADALDEVFDQAIAYHGFTDYMRDYEVLFHCTADPSTRIDPEHVRFLFKNCVQADVTSMVPPEVWKVSLDDRLIDFDRGVLLDGFVWGVKWQENYPGATVIANSAKADRWTDSVGITFYEVRIEANGHALDLVFSDLTVTTAETGYAPFVVV